MTFQKYSLQTSRVVEELEYFANGLREMSKSLTLYSVDIGL